MPWAADERWIDTADGARLYVRLLGSPDAPPLVALHGGPGAHHDYLLPAFGALADAWRLVLYDQRGGGRSQGAPGLDLTWERHVEDVAAVFDALDIGRGHLLGYSFGGLLAMLFASRSPERIDRLALTSSAPPWFGYRDPLDRALAAAQTSPAVVAERTALEQSGFREADPAEYRRRRFALSVAGYFADPRVAYGLTPFKVFARAAEAIKRSLGDYDFRNALGGIDGNRTLVVHGERDPIDIALAEETARILGARLERIPECGHVPYVEAPERFFGILRRFFGGMP